MSERNTDPLKTATRKALERLSLLTFQQKQLIETGEFAPVLQQILRGRLLLTAVISGFTLLFGYFALRSATIGDISWPSVSAVAGFSWWLFSRLSKERNAVKSVRQYAETNSGDGSSTSALVTELRLNYRLSYDQHHRLKQGQPVEIATEIAAARRQNGKTMLLWVWPLSAGLFILDAVQPQDPNAPDGLFVYDFIAVAITCSIIILTGLIFGLRELRMASALEQKIDAEKA